MEQNNMLGNMEVDWSENAATGTCGCKDYCTNAGADLSLHQLMVPVAFSGSLLVLEGSLCTLMKW